LYVADIVIPSAWVSLCGEGLEGTVMIIGVSDVASPPEFAICRNSRAADLDADMGQSTLSLPTTLNLVVSSEPGDDHFPPHGRQVSFISSTRFVEL